VYKGRGKDEKPIHEWVPASKVSKDQKFNKPFKKPYAKKTEEERPQYNFEKLEKNHKKKDTSEEIRLNKYISNSGICSRREADNLIQKGEIKVNGEVITEMGYKVQLTDRVTYKGKMINPEKPVYLLLNKPKDFITTTDDPMERKTVMSLIANACEERVFPVGRLDRNTTGLLLFTNDGELAAKLSHPSNNVKKIYQVTLDKPITHADEEAILEGLNLEDGPAKVDDMQVLSKDRTIIGLEIHLGRNRIVRRIFAHLGYEVVALDRVMYAGLDKKDLPRGRYRFLAEKEVIRLKYF
jgi:23S rRNA pseudouridine2605 synthase